uniref:Uncharacterized protein n=1 Tax=Anguilla anguilla TaxID=7936 RepID=A0A0E9XNZ3_ANGAN
MSDEDKRNPSGGRGLLWEIPHAWNCRTLNHERWTLAYKSNANKFQNDTIFPPEWLCCYTSSL